ncbi:MAG: hypothetical protein PHD88_01450 [Firmicutes bacterium]|nr:hypothetical protein [Bacillota bacterium]MDD4262914.1 hypothetical protein [Bacillota bacterium]MDD4693059.1 hypothetical protein [Bacillota bacterium]
MKIICKLAILFFVVLSLQVFAKFYVVTLPYVSLNEILSEKHLGDFLNRSSLGLLNVQTGSFGNLSSSYVTFGAGARAYGFSGPVAIYSPQDFYNEQLETAEEIYNQRSSNPLPDGALVFVDIEAVKNSNKELYYEVIPGLLASSLSLKGLSTAYIGNAGTIETHLNPGALALINRQGVIFEGEHSETLKKNPLKPLGVEADMEKIVFLLDQVEADLILIELGDLERIESVTKFISEAAYNRHRKEALGKVGQFLKDLTSRINGDEDSIILVSPLPSGINRQKGYGLGFLAIYQGDKSSSLLYSSTTRRVGLVALTDLAPTLEAWAGIQDPFVFHQGGAVLEAKAADRETIISYLLEIESNSATLKSIRTRFYQIYISVLILTIISAFVCIVIFPIKELAMVLRMLLFSEAAVPLFMLFVGLAPAEYYLLVFFILLAFAALIGVISVRTPKLGYLWPILTTFALFSLSLDIVFQARLISRSVFGYDFQSGARFYGIGNEYMGYFVGLLLLGAYILGFVYKKKTVVLVPLGLGVVFIAFPILGANVGGGITMIVAFFAWTKLILNTRLTPYLLVLPLFLGVWVLIDFLRGQSHLINTIMAIFHGGYVVIWEVISRKISTNLRLWQYSLWTKGLIVFVAGLVLVLFKPANLVTHKLTQIDSLKQLLLITALTAASAVAFNDSGVVAGALVILVPGCFILSSLLCSIDSKA